MPSKNDMIKSMKGPRETIRISDWLTYNQELTSVYSIWVLSLIRFLYFLKINIWMEKNYKY